MYMNSRFLLHSNSIRLLHRETCILTSKLFLYTVIIRSIVHAVTTFATRNYIITHIIDYLTTN